MFLLKKQQQRRPICRWSARGLNLLSQSFLGNKATPSPLRRSGQALPASTTAAGELFLFGGLPNSRDSARGDLYVFSTRDLSVTLLKTNGEVPSPHFGHASALIGDDLLIWGGATNTGDQGEVRRKGPHDNSLYLLNLPSRNWTRVVVNGPCPEGRYYHAVTMVGSKLFVFGGRIHGKFLNDMWAFDLNSLKSNPAWDPYEPASGDEKTAPRDGHVLVTIGDRIILFGGADSRYHYNDTWLFESSTRKWTELQCTGDIPSPRDGHAAAVVDNVVYIFGGRGVDGAKLADLLAFELSTRRWIRLQNMGPSPSGRWRHGMASDGAWVYVLGGESSVTAQGDKTALIYVFNTKHIEYPNTDPNAVKPSEKITQRARKSSASTSSQEQPQHPKASPSDAYTARGPSPFQKAPAQDLGRLAIPQITQEQNSSSNGLPSQPTGANGKPRGVPEEDDDGEDSAEYHAKFVAPYPSSEGEVARLDRERLVELERRLSATLAAQTERDQRLAQLTDELAVKSALLEQAEANAAKATRRVGLEHVDRLLAQAEQKDADLVNMQAKLDDVLLSRDQHMRAHKQRIGQYETAELEVRKSELEAVRSRLTDAEMGWVKSRIEADTLRALTVAGRVSPDEDRITRGLVERMRAVEVEVASLRCSEKSSEAMESRNER